MEQEVKDYAKKIEQLRITLGRQELSTVDVRRMKRETELCENKIAEETRKLDEEVAALGEAQDKLSAVNKLLQDSVDNYNAKARQLALIPESAKYAGGKKFEISFHEAWAMKGEVGYNNMMGVLKSHISTLVAEFVGRAKQANEIEGRNNSFDEMKHTLVEVSFKLHFFPTGPTTSPL